MSPQTKRAPMICPKCGSTMNHHAVKLVEPQNSAEAALMDVKLGGLVEEFHACPACGAVASRMEA